MAQQATEIRDEVASRPIGEAREVATELVEQGQTFAEDARTQVEEQAKEQTRRLAGTLTRLGNEAQALVEGRPEDAEHVREYMRRAGEGLTGTADRLYDLADDVDERGLGGVFQDLSRFARRRPGMFLLGAAVAGFAFARAMRSSSANDDSDDEEDAPGRPASTAGADGDSHIEGRVMATEDR